MTERDPGFHGLKSPWPFFILLEQSVIRRPTEKPLASAPSGELVAFAGTDWLVSFSGLGTAIEEVETLAR